MELIGCWRSGVSALCGQITNVGDEEAALEQKLSARQVLVPGFGLFPPGFSSLIMNSPLAHRHSRFAIEPRLMGIAMKHQPIDSFGKGSVGEGLEREGMVLPLGSDGIGSECFGSDN